MTTLTTNQAYQLDQFEGPLDFLLYLVQRNELEIEDISIQQITEQFLALLKREEENELDEGAEFLALTAQLLLIKSRSLLPKHEQQGDDEEELDPKFEIIHQLMEYCRFRDLAKDFSALEDQVTGLHYRGISDEEKALRLPSGVEHLSLEDLAGVFRDSLAKAASRHGGAIDEEEWRVIDKVRELRRTLKEQKSLAAIRIFSPDKSRNELIVYFLAILELMKLGEIAIIRETATGNIAVVARSREEEESDGQRD